MEGKREKSCSISLIKEIFKNTVNIANFENSEKITIDVGTEEYLLVEEKNEEKDEKNLKIFTHLEKITKPKNLSKIFKEIQFSFDIDWPLSVLFDSSFFKYYNTVFRFVLSLKRSKFCLEKKKNSLHFSVDKKFLSLLKKTEKQFFFVRLILFHFVNNLLSYVMEMISSSERNISKEIIVEHCNDFSQLKSFVHSKIR